MASGIGALIEDMLKRLRKLESSLNKIELREKQIIVMFKILMDRVVHRTRSDKKKINVNDIIHYMDSLVREQMPGEYINSKEHDVDLISEAVKKAN